MSFWPQAASNEHVDCTSARQFDCTLRVCLVVRVATCVVKCRLLVEINASETRMLKL